MRQHKVRDLTQSPRDILNSTSLDLSYLLRSSSDTGGTWESVFRGSGPDTVLLRPYQPGDRHRDVHRPSFARFRRGERREFSTRESTDERNMMVWIIMNLSPFLVRSGALVSPYAKPSKDGALFFSAVVMGAAAFWGIPVGLYSSNSDSMTPKKGTLYFQEILSCLIDMPAHEISDLPRINQDGPYGISNSLVFFVSGFVSNAEQTISTLEHIRFANKNDVVPVFLDPSWIWDTVEGSWEFSGLRTDKRGRKELRQEAEERKHVLDALFTNAGLPWIHLTTPEPKTIEERMTRCFLEKRRSR